MEYKVLVEDGTTKWYYNGKLHREDGPAVEYSTGVKAWYKEGNLHREGGPALEYPNGYKEWFKEGKFHREDGPAVEYTNGNKDWYLEGEKLSEEEFLKRTNLHLCDKVVEVDGVKYTLVKV